MSLKGAINSASDLYNKLQVESDQLEKEVTDHDFHNFVKTARELFEWVLYLLQLILKPFYVFFFFSREP